MIEHVRFKDWNCDIIYGQYANQRMAIQLFETSSDSPSPIATASVNLPDEPMDHNEIAIKDCSENEGMLSALIVAGIVTMPLRMVTSGHVIIPICTYTGMHSEGLKP
jgi:hypothetical protein